MIHKIISLDDINIMEIRKCDRLNGELGLFATRVYMKGETVFELSGDVYNEPSKHSIHIGDNKHIIDKFGSFMNHSFSPSVEIKGVSVIALKEIKTGDEIAFDYNASEVNMASPFVVNGVKVSGRSSSD